ncbi:hypothetical protein PCANB_000365 [Pneumocystis canis]|nr:hypothetical protein PCANB_000365 [Pneumocystis canis]
MFTEIEINQIKQTENIPSNDSKIIDSSKCEKSGKFHFFKTLKNILLGPKPSCTNVIPEIHANIFSRLLWSWLDHLMILGYKRPLQITDLWYIDEARTSKVMGDKLYEYFEKRKNSKYSLLKTFNDMFRGYYWSAGIIKSISNIIIILSTIIIKHIIIFSQKKALHRQQPNVYPKQNIGYGIALCFTLYIAQTISSFCFHHSFYRSISVAALTKTALISCIYRKSLLLKNNQRLKFNNGKIMNLVSTDVDNISNAIIYAHILWTSFIQITFIYILLYLNLGISALVGILLLVIFVPILGKATKSLVKKNVKISEIADIRIRLINEMLHSIKTIKLYAWEKSFLEKILNTRKKEEKYIKLLHVIQSSIDSLSMNLSFFCIILTFITYYRIKQHLSPAIVFSSLTLLNLVRIPLMLIIFGTTMIASLKRIEAMLCDEDDFEYSDTVKKIKNILTQRESENSENTETEESDYAVVIKNGYFTYSQSNITRESKKVKPGISGKFLFKKKHPSNQSNTLKSSEYLREETQIKIVNENFDKELNKSNSFSDITLQTEQETEKKSNKNYNKKIDFRICLENINLKIKKGELVCIIGPSGSGKSTLLLSIINETYKIHGAVNLNGTIGYCPQTSWIQNSAIIDNILFGEPYDEHKYKKVIEACCLDLDFQIFPDGDLTIIGEKGVTISGGQKQRINIARTVYFDADIILLDDSLSSIDSHVSKDIFEKCILGFLKNKTVIFVTHKLDILDKVDRIIYLENGRIMETGNYSELISKQKYFYHFIQEFIKTEENEEISRDLFEKGESKKEIHEPDILMQNEEREIGAIKWDIYIGFIKAAGGFLLIPVIILLLVLFEFTNIGHSLWLSFWSKDQFKKSANFYTTIFVTLGVLQTFLYFIIYFTFYTSCKHAATNLHHKAIERIVRAPMSFFNTTPLGRIINKFTKDIKILDNMLADSYLVFSLTLSYLIAVFILIIVYLHYFVIPLIFLLSLFFILTSFYRKSSREIKRLDSIKKSDLYAQINETLTGLTVIRAYGKQSKFKLENEKRINISNSAAFLTFSCEQWLALRLDVIGNIIILSITILSVLSNIDPASIGLILSYCLQIVNTMCWMLTYFSKVEINMNSVERLHHYANKLKTEAPLVIPGKKPPPDWPQNGEIIFNNVWLKYRENLPFSLKNINVHINKGEKVGIVGRTGAGKSSIIVALYRLVEISKGSIIIDGISISDIGLHDLRKKMFIIPQELAFFEGTIRSNLDPFNEYTDQEIWDSLKKSWFLDSIKKSYTSEEKQSCFNLESPVEIEGQNYSHGQLQLLTIARALLRKPKIIIFDEATSNIDAKTEKKIQNTIQTEFKNATVLCIGNRIRTVINYDTILVINLGTLSEYGSPQKLFNKQNGIFRSLCINAGITNI